MMVVLYYGDQEACDWVECGIYNQDKIASVNNRTAFCQKQTESLGRKDVWKLIQDFFSEET
jgi:hypothetical protein